MKEDSTNQNQKRSIVVNKIEKELEKMSRKDMKRKLLVHAKGASDFSVMAKKVELTGEQKGVYFGKCGNCALKRDAKFNVNTDNSLDPSIKARVKCAAINELWVTPMLYDGNADCSRRKHVAAKKMLRTTVTHPGLVPHVAHAT